MYGITFASQNKSNSMHTYNVCYINSNTSTLYTLNPNGTGLGSVRINDHVNCSYDENNLKEYYTDSGVRRLTCRQNNSVNNGNSYWQNTSRSCDLNEIKNNYSDIINKQLAYGCSACLKDINTIMTAGSKQVRIYSAGTWSMLYTTFKQNSNEGEGVSRNIDIYCNDNGTWSINSSGHVNYGYRGYSQTFTPSKYGISNGKQLTLEVYGAQGGGDINAAGSPKGGKGGKTTANYNISSAKTLYVVVGGVGRSSNGGYNGGGNGGTGGSSNANGGGGATHISTISGLLNVENVWNNVLIVAGGGGGGTGTAGHRGGAGGSYSDDNGKKAEIGTNHGGEPGTQIGGGMCYDGKNGTNGTAGQGGDGQNSKNGGGGGGGGYYGGGGGDGADNGVNTGGGGGGSGFCGNGAYNCGGSNSNNKGNGYAKISW